MKGRACQNVPAIITQEVKIIYASNVLTNVLNVLIVPTTVLSANKEIDNQLQLAVVHQDCMIILPHNSVKNVIIDLAESVMTTACYALAGVFKNAFNAIIKGNYLTVCVLMVYLKIQKEFVNNVA